MNKFYMIMGGLLLAASAVAAPLTPSQALQRCTATETGLRTAPATRFTVADLSYTLQRDNEPVLYIFARPGQGFAIASADDIAEPLLGYSETGSFVATNIPENMLWWLGEYQREIEHAKSAGVRRSLKAVERPMRNPIAPLCATKWNQGDPFNLTCPTVNGQRTYTGCVATAMAQVMKHHNWPEKGKGSNSYNWNGQTLTMNFAEQEFDWENMTDTYTTLSTTAQKNAIAQLMTACGYSVNMSYGLSGSGAQSAMVPRALINNFYYSKSCMFLGRDYVPLIRWENMIYESLCNDAPVYYSGQNMTVGHAFVCDGYSQDGYFHFNWGWGGVSDGYFRLTALDPSSQGIGGSNDGYNIYQSALLNALPNTTTVKPMVELLSESTVTVSYNESSEALTLTGSFRNQAQTSVNTMLGLEVYNLATKASTVYTTGEVIRLGSKALASSIAVSMAKPAAGTYAVVPVYNSTVDQSEATWEEMLMPLGEPSIAYMEVTDSAINISYPEYDLMQATNLELKSDIYINRNYKLGFDLHNTLPSEIYEFFFVGLIRDNSLMAISDPYSIDIMGDGTEHVDFVGNFGNVAAGSYSIGIVQPYGNTYYLISELLPVEMASAPSTESFTITDFTIENPNEVNCSDIHLSFKLNVSEGYFSYPVTAYVFPANGGYSQGSQSFETIFLNAGQSQTYNFTASIPSLRLNTNYMMGLYVDGDSYASTNFRVITNGVSVIEGAEDWNVVDNGSSAMLTAPETLTGLRVFNMAGMPQNTETVIDGNRAIVNTAELPHGIYLLRATTATSSRVIRLVK